MMLSGNATGVTPVIEVRRGMPGVMRGGLWTPLAIRGGDGTEEGGEKPLPGGATNNPPAPKAEEKPNDESQFSEQARLTIQKLRNELKEAKAGGKKADELQAKLDEYEKSQLTEKERLERERDEATAKLTQAEQKSRDRVIRSEVRVLASELGFADPSDAHAFLDVSSIEFDEDGEPKGIKKLLEDLAKAKPYLLKSTNGTTGVPGTPKANGQTKTREELIEEKKKALLAARV